MFDFHDETGSEERYHEHTEAKTTAFLVKHRAWWLIHNLVAHPLIGVVPTKTTFDFHDWTSRKMNGLK